MHIHPHGQKSERVGVSPREYSDVCGMPCVRPPLVYVHFCEHEKARRRARRGGGIHGLSDRYVPFVAYVWVWTPSCASKVWLASRGCFLLGSPCKVSYYVM